MARIHSHSATGYGELTQLHTLIQNSDHYFRFKFLEGLNDAEITYHHLYWINVVIITKPISIYFPLWMARASRIVIFGQGISWFVMGSFKVF